MSKGQTRGRIEGNITDPTDMVVAGATVQLTEEGTQLVRKTTSDERGDFYFLQVDPGAYTLNLSHKGFRSIKLEDMNMAAGQTRKLDFQFQLGELTQQIEVTSRMTTLTPSTSDWGDAVSQEQIENLPLNGRDLFDLTVLEPAAYIAVNAERTMSAPGLQVSSNGARPNQNGFQLDGLSVNGAGSGAPASATGNLLGLEMIQELRVVTAPFQANFGRSAGAILTGVTKKGSNALHGSLYEFLRHSSLDARNFFDDPEQPIPPLSRNQFGIFASGPIQKDRWFFSANYEGIRQTISQSVSSTVPSLDARQGILPLPGGGTQQIEIAPQVIPYLDLYPMPNGRDFGDGLAEYNGTNTDTATINFVAGRIDYIVSDKTQLFGRYSFDQGLLDVGDQLQIWRFPTRSRNQFFGLELQHTASSKTVYSLRFSFNRQYSREYSVPRSDISSDLSFVPGQKLGSMQIVGLSNFGYARALLRPRHFISNDGGTVFQWEHISGNNSWSAGLGYDRIHFNQLSARSAVGHYKFTSLRNFLEGTPATGEVMMPGSDGYRGWRQNLFYAYLQWERKFLSNFQFSAGVRYEPYSVPTEVNGKIATLPHPESDTDMTVGGPLFVNPSKDNFAPRASLAWDPMGKGNTVVRAGAGVFFDLLGSRELLIAGARVPPFYNRVLLTNPIFPDIMTSVAEGEPSKSLDGFDYYVNQPYVVHYQLTLEQALGRNWIARASYAGSRGVHLPGQLGNINPVKPEVQADGRLYFPEDAPRINPNFDQIGMRRTHFNSFYNALHTELQHTALGSRWNMQVRYSWAKSIDETSSTVFQEFLNSDLFPTMLNYRQNRGLSDFDVRHLFSANVLVTLPELKSHRYSWLLGDWRLQSTVQIQSGQPFSPWVGFDRARLKPGPFELGQRPNFTATAGSPAILGGVDQYFDALAFSLPEAGYYGDLGRNVFIGPGLFVLNVGIQKKVWSTESAGVHVRVEAFNATNHPNFQIPSNLDLFNSSLARLGNAGRITETSTEARQIQLGFKLLF